MSQWNFVWLAYVLVLLATIGLVLGCWRAMRRAEADAEAVRRR